MNGVFLAYPSDWVGQAIYISETNALKFPDVGLISLTLYRSHIIRRAKRRERVSEQIWKEQDLEDKDFLNQVAKKTKLEQSDRLTTTALRDGCFWVSSNRKHEEQEELTSFSFSQSDWKGLALLYGASSATSWHRYFSIDTLYDDYCRGIGWKKFDLTKLEFSGLAYNRTYGNLLSMWGLSEAGIFFLKQVLEALEKNLEKNDCKRLEQKITEWRSKHKESQNIKVREFMNFLT